MHVPSLLCSLALTAMNIRGVASHMAMAEPKPYTPADINYKLNPLDKDGGDISFPCGHLSGDAPTPTTVKAGGSQLVTFEGALAETTTALHNGGSCQFSVSYGDGIPNAKSEWHVIYSIIGGCPGVSTKTPGNLVATDANVQCTSEDGTDCIRQFNIPIPKEMKNGKATFAWTWFNNVGNREMYMNCAPIEITGGSNSDAFVKKLPDVFKANIPGECENDPLGGIFVFPDPGQYGKVLVKPDGNHNGECKAASLPTFTKGGSSTSSDEPADEPVASSLPNIVAPEQPATTSAAAPSSKSPIQSFITVAPSSTTIQAKPSTTSAAPAHSSKAEVPAVSSVVEAGSSVAAVTSTAAAQSTFITTIRKPTKTSTTQAVVSTTAAPVESAAPAESTVPVRPPKGKKCIKNGQLICLENGYFGLCDHGWVIPQRVSEGTKCSDSKIDYAK